MSPQTMIDALTVQMGQTEPKVTFEASAPIMIGTHNAARATGTSSQGDVLVIVVALDSSYLMATSVISEGELSKREPTLIRIITSATYTPAP